MSEQFCTTWPGGTSAAAAFCFDLDAESAVLSSAPEAASRMSVMTHQSYGPLVGVPRLLGLLKRHDIRATFFVPGYTAHRYPDVVRSIADAGHELAHHGYLHEPLGQADEAKEIEYLERGIAALEEVAGVRPIGYRAPMWELNYRSPGLLQRYGFLYDSSLMDADQPYELAAGPGDERLVEIPIHWAVDDWEQYCYLPGLFETNPVGSPLHAREMWSAELRATTAEGGCFVLTAHPFLSGRPARAASLSELMREATEMRGVWVASMEEIANYTRSLGLSPRRLTQPELDV